MNKKIKWFIAWHILSRSRSLCWADVILWADGVRDELITGGADECRKDRDTCGTCYCGKFMTREYKDAQRQSSKDIDELWGIG